MQLNVEDLQRALKLLSVSMSEERLRLVADYLNQNFETLKPLTARHLPKELEPASYLKLLADTSNSHETR